MDMDFPTRRIVEGRVALLVPDVPRRAGPGTRSSLPFYNPTMAVGRDLSVLAAARAVPRGATALDGLAAAGALGLRLASESGSDLDVTLNDRNPRAAALVRANLDLNPRVRATVTCGDLNAHLATHHYDLVEVDPFGSPVPFLDAALASAHRGSVLAVSATDTAVLSGAKPEAARRRYLARVAHTDAYAEVGLRVLLGYIARMAARSDRAVEPLAAYAAEHFVKAHLRITQGAARADRCLEHVGWTRYDPASGEHAVGAGDPPEGALGPLWIGPLTEPGVLGGLSPQEGMTHAAGVLVERLREEAGLPPFYADNNAMARRARVDPPPLDTVLEALRASGHRAVRTHFARNALKTDAPWGEVLDAYRSLGGR